jgi:GDP-L-fucose synthase
MPQSSGNTLRWKQNIIQKAIQVNKDSRIAVFGASGMLGSAIVRNLRARGYENVLTPDRQGADLRSDWQTHNLFNLIHPEVVIMSAGYVGGIQSNMKEPGRFLADNLSMALNPINEAVHVHSGVKKYCYVGSSCIYPRDCPQPMQESYLGTGAFEPTNEGYAIAKYAGVKLAQFYAQQYGMRVSLPIPCNLYGTNDNFGEGGHVLASLVKRFVDAVDENLPQVTVWGSGNARREFLHVDDAADGIVHLMERHNDPTPINVGSGKDIYIWELAQLIATEAGFTGEIIFDPSKPDGMKQKLLDTSRITALGWQPKIDLAEGIKRTVDEYRSQKELT